MIDYVTGTAAVEALTEATNALIEAYGGYFGATEGGYIATNIGGQTVLYTNATTAETLSITAGTATEATTAAASNMMGETVTATMVNSGASGVTTGIASTVGTALGYTIVAGLLAYMGYKLTETAYLYDPIYWDGVIEDIIGVNPHVIFSNGNVLIPQEIVDRAYDFAANLSFSNSPYDTVTQQNYNMTITKGIISLGTQQEGYSPIRKDYWYQSEMTVEGGIIVITRGTPLGYDNSTYWIFSESPTVSPRVHTKKTFQYDNGDVQTFEYTDDSFTKWTAVDQTLVYNGKTYYRFMDPVRLITQWYSNSLLTWAMQRYIQANGPAYADYEISGDQSTDVGISRSIEPYPVDSTGTLPNWSSFNLVSEGSPIDIIPGAVTPVPAGDIATSYPDWWRWQVLNNIKPNEQGQPQTVPDSDADVYIPIVPMSDAAIEAATASDIAANQDIGTLTEQQKQAQIAPNAIPEIVNGSQTISEPVIQEGVNPTQPIGNNTGNIPAPIIAYDSTDTGFIAIYHPTKAQLKSFNQWLWSTNFFDNILKIFQDPMAAIISLHQIYCTPTNAGQTNIKVGYLDSGVNCNYITDNIVEINCGTKFVSYFYKNALDCIGNTEIDVYLPFIGFRTLNINDVNNSNVNIKYNIDILSGTCCAIISVQKSGLNSILYTFNGNCAVQLPLTSSNFSSMMQGLVGTVAGAGAAMLTGGAATPFLAAGATSMLNAKVGIERSGNISGNAGALAYKKPYIVIRRPIAKTAYQYNKFMGYPASANAKLSTCNGYTRIKEIILDSLSATSEEKNMLRDQLRTGVII